MSFSNRRGRPKSELPRHDYGTPELIFKRAHGLTAEPLDQCLERGLIRPDQHWCGLHLRWLYTLRYGAPGVSALDLTATGGAAIAGADPQWRSEREREYQAATDVLKHYGLDDAVMRAAVYSEPCRFLNHRLHEEAYSRPRLAAQLLQELRVMQDGLDYLSRHWQRGPYRPQS